MRAVVLDRFGGPEVLSLVERPDPVAKPGTVVVRVAAANVNPTDLAARQGFVVGDAVQPPLVLGWDLAGTVEAVGDGVSGHDVGERVVGMIPWYAIGGRIGAYAELVAVVADWVVPLPESLGFAEAATIPLNALTARQALDLLDPAPGSPILVTGASGAVGAFATQLALAAGHEVTAMGAGTTRTTSPASASPGCCPAASTWRRRAASRSCSTPSPSAGRPSPRWPTAARWSPPVRSRPPTQLVGSARRWC